MPRQGRLDAPGILHHVIIRGIERRYIFKDDQQRNWGQIFQLYNLDEDGSGLKIQYACQILKPVCFAPFRETHMVLRNSGKSGKSARRRF